MRAAPTEIGSPISSRTLARIRRPTTSAVAEQAHRPGDVEEGFVDGDPLDEWREVVEHRHDLVAQPLVLREVAADEREVGAQLLGSPTRHPSLHSEFLGLVGRRQHHAASDGYRLPRRSGCSICSTDA